jgi:cytochrome c oxidase subunit IV
MTMEHPVVPVKTYILVYLALLFLLVLTLAIAYIEMAGLNTILAIFVASLKAFLVILYFMHVRYSTILTRVFIISGFLWMAILVGFTLTDYFTRGGLFINP